MKVNLPLGILLLAGCSALATEITFDSPLLATAAPYSPNVWELKLPDCFEAAPETNQTLAASKELKHAEHGPHCGCAIRIQLGNDGNDSIYSTEPSGNDS